MTADLTTKMIWPYLNDMLRSLPSYAEVTALTEDGKAFRLMARDMPGTDKRRFTCLTTGTEWFVTKGGWAMIRKIEFPSLDIEAVQ